MHLSTETIEVLRNFATINQSILIKPGNKLRTMSVMKTILAEADVSETFPHEIGIYDLSQFLNCLSIIPNPELVLGDNHLEIKSSSDDDKSITYRYADASVITSPPDKKLTLPSSDVCLELSSDNLNQIIKASSILQCPDLTFIGDRQNVYGLVRDKKNTGTNSFLVCLGETTSEFEFNVKLENLKLITGDYDVVISEKNLSKFTHHSRPIEYFIPMEPDSTYSA